MSNGVMSNTELIDSLILDLNTATKQIVSGNYLAWCQTNVGMVQKLTNLKKGIQNDLASKDQTIEDLKNQLRDVGVEIVDMDPQDVMEKLKEAPEHE